MPSVRVLSSQMLRLLLNVHRAASWVEVRASGEARHLFDVTAQVLREAAQLAAAKIEASFSVHSRVVRSLVERRLVFGRTTVEGVVAFLEINGGLPPELIVIFKVRFPWLREDWATQS